MTRDQLKTYRQQWQIGQQELAAELGTTRRTLYSWESGRVPIPDTVTPARLRDIALRIAPRMGPRTHPEFYRHFVTRRADGSRCPLTEKRPTHPHRAWGLTMTKQDFGDGPITIVHNTFTDLDGNPLDIREVAHLPSGTVVKRDGLNWIVP